MLVLALLVLVGAGVALVITGHVGRRPATVVAGAGLLVATVGFFAFLSFWGEMLWFQELGFLRRFWTRVVAQLVVMLIGVLGAIGLVRILTAAAGGTRARKVGLVTAGVLGALWGAVSWDTALRWAFGVRTGLADPVLGMDTGFYMFTLPLLRAAYWLAFLTAVLALATAVGSVAGARERAIRRTLALAVEDGPPTKPEREELTGRPVALGPRTLDVVFPSLGALALVLAFGRLLAPFELMNSEQGVVHGAGWTDVHVRLPAYFVLAAVLTGVALLLLLRRPRAAFEAWLARRRFGRSPETLAAATVGTPIAAVAAVWVLGLGVLPALLQWLVVEPNELAYERRYLENNIAFTRRGFNLADVAIQEFPVKAELTPEVVEENAPLLSEVRLWDPHAFDAVVQQFQALRLYYEITGTDFDRYELDGAYRQVMIAARELEVTNLPAESQTFVNRHFKYTHGYGVVMAPVSDFDPAGLPELVVRDLPPVAEHREVRVEQPAIYYGELTKEYVVANSEAPEFDYPQGGTNVYTHYAGTGGVPLSSFWRKLAYAWKIGGTRFLFTSYPREESRMMFRRQIGERIATVAPFLTLDHDPYSVVVDGKIKWIIDAYTTSSDYPYSEPYGRVAPETEAAERRAGLRASTSARRLADANYLRNSVKAVVDAYDGSVQLYVFDPTDPVVRVWSRAYPDLFRPKEAMPAPLRAHVRYPEAMLETQGHVFAKYHMTDPVVFYNQEDLWVQATEKYYDEVRPVQPYYVMWQAPGSSDLEFILMQPYTPRKRQVLIGWIAGLCDGDNYGRLVAYRFPKEKWVLGPQQVDTKIDQSPELSAQLTLWDQHGKRVIRGNVLAIPIDETILYVEPIYIQAQTAAYPELRMVVLMHGDRMSYAPTFARALEGLVSGKPSVALPEAEAARPAEDASAANHALDEYIRLTAEGRFAEAGKQLEALRESLRRLEDEGSEPPTR